MSSRYTKNMENYFFVILSEHNEMFVKRFTFSIIFEENKKKKIIIITVEKIY